MQENDLKHVYIPALHSKLPPSLRGSVLECLSIDELRIIQLELTIACAGAITSMTRVHQAFLERIRHIFIKRGNSASLYEHGPEACPEQERVMTQWTSSIQAIAAAKRLMPEINDPKRAAVFRTMLRDPAGSARHRELSLLMLTACSQYTTTTKTCIRVTLKHTMMSRNYTHVPIACRLFAVMFANAEPMTALLQNIAIITAQSLSDGGDPFQHMRACRITAELASSGVALPASIIANLNKLLDEPGPGVKDGALVALANTIPSGSVMPVEFANILAYALAHPAFFESLFDILDQLIAKKCVIAENVIGALERLSRHKDIQTCATALSLLSRIRDLEPVPEAFIVKCISLLKARTRNWKNNPYQALAQLVSHGFSLPATIIIELLAIVNLEFLDVSSISASEWKSIDYTKYFAKYFGQVVLGPDFSAVLNPLCTITLNVPALLKPLIEKLFTALDQDTHVTRACRGLTQLKTKLSAEQMAKLKEKLIEQIKEYSDTHSMCEDFIEMLMQLSNGHDLPVAFITTLTTMTQDSDSSYAAHAALAQLVRGELTTVPDGFIHALLGQCAYRDQPGSSGSLYRRRAYHILLLILPLLSSNQSTLIQANKSVQPEAQLIRVQVRLATSPTLSVLTAAGGGSKDGEAVSAAAIPGGGGVGAPPP